MSFASGQTAFVTGGGGGIGLAAGEAFARRGLNVVLADINGPRLDAAVAAFAGPVLGIRLDIADAGDWERARIQAEARFGPIDVLLNCAGTPPAQKPLLDLTDAEFDGLLTTHVKGTFNGVRCFGRPMRDRGRGHIATVASECGLIPMALLGDYTAAKYGVVGMTEVLRREMADHGVQVSLACPGITRSNMTVGMGMEASFVGEAIVRGIEADAFYILTHPSMEPSLRRRFEEVLGALGEPAQPDYVSPETQWQ